MGGYDLKRYEEPVPKVYPPGFEPVPSWTRDQNFARLQYELAVARVREQYKRVVKSAPTWLKFNAGRVRLKIVEAHRDQAGYKEDLHEDWRSAAPPAYAANIAPRKVDPKLWARRVDR